MDHLRRPLTTVKDGTLAVPGASPSKIRKMSSQNIEIVDIVGNFSPRTGRSFDSESDHQSRTSSERRRLTREDHYGKF
jgi:hypothetical protein